MADGSLWVARSNQLADSGTGRCHFTGCQVLQGHLRSSTWRPRAARRMAWCAHSPLGVSGGRALLVDGLPRGRIGGTTGLVWPWVVAGWTRPARSCILRHPTSLRNVSSLRVGWRVNPTAAVPCWFSQVQCSPSNHSRIAVRVCAPPGVTPCPASTPVQCRQTLTAHRQTAMPASAGNSRIACRSTPIRPPGFRSGWPARLPKSG